MTSRTKEEQRLLDEKIARIQKQNEEILRRQKEIEEDKRLAEQQNAVVRLRPLATNVSRERTPALKPSNRELKRNFGDESSEIFDEPDNQRNIRESFQGRGRERRGHTDFFKGNGPPPDPRSFLFDEERYTGNHNKDWEERSEGRRDSNRRDWNQSAEGWSEQPGGREYKDFQNQGPRGSISPRGNRRGLQGGRVGSKVSEEEAWRAERMRIDEARIQRQKAADGRWRREWDSEKIDQEPPEEARSTSRGSNQSDHEQWQPSSVYHCPKHSPTENCPRRDNREAPASGAGRGRGRLTQSELEKSSLDFKLQIKDLKLPATHNNASTAENSISQSRQKDFDLPPSPVSPREREQRRRQQVKNHPSSPSSQEENFKFDTPRQIRSVGSTFKISIPNPRPLQSTRKPHRQSNESRGRARSQSSYSSQSDDDSPRGRDHRGDRRQRTQKNQRQEKSSFAQKTPPTKSHETTPNSSLTSQSKPPLPPSRPNQKHSSKSESKEEGDEGSWEDITTSGNESMGEDPSSRNSTPVKKHPNINIVNWVSVESQPVMYKKLTVENVENCPSEVPFDEHLCKLGVEEAKETMGELGTSLEDSIKPLKQLQQMYLDASKEITLEVISSTNENNLKSNNSEPVTTSESTSKTHFETTFEEVSFISTEEKVKDDSILQAEDETISAVTAQIETSSEATENIHLIDSFNSKQQIKENEDLSRTDLLLDRKEDKPPGYGNCGENSLENEALNNNELVGGEGATDLLPPTPERYEEIKLKGGTVDENLKG